MTSSTSKSSEEELKEMNEQLNAMGFDNLGQYMAEFQKNVKKMANLQRDGAKMAGVLKTCKRCQKVGEKRCTGTMAQNLMDKYLVYYHSAKFKSSF